MIYNWLMGVALYYNYHQKNITMNTLLIPTDFSPVADNALKYALEMATNYKLDITLLNVELL